MPKNKKIVQGDTTVLVVRRTDGTERNVLIDTEDLPRLKGKTIGLEDSGKYARFTDKGKSIKLSRFLTNAPEGVLVDHGNLNKLDNRKLNLRFTNNQENAQNQLGRSKTSKHRGVHWHDRDKCWYVQVQYKGKHFCGGLYDDEEEARLAAELLYSVLMPLAPQARPLQEDIGDVLASLMMRKRIKNSTEYRGIHQTRGKWRVHVRHKVKQLSAYFGNVDDAVKAAHGVFREIALYQLAEVNAKWDQKKSNSGLAPVIPIRRDVMQEVIEAFGEANGCRYFEELIGVLGEVEAEQLLRLDYEADWQGFLDCDVLLKDGRVFSYYYNYGSCSGCDEWESRELSFEEIITEMREAATYFKDYETYVKWRHSVEAEAA